MILRHVTAKYGQDAVSTNVRTDEREFLEPLCKRGGDTIFQSTPIKSRRSCAAAGTSYNGECNQ